MNLTWNRKTSFLEENIFFIIIYYCLYIILKLVASPLSYMEGEGSQENSLNPQKDIYKVFLKSTTKFGPAVSEIFNFGQKNLLLYGIL